MRAWIQVLLLIALGAAALCLAARIRVPPDEPGSVLYPTYRYLRLMLLVSGGGALLVAVRLVAFPP